MLKTFPKVGAKGLRYGLSGRTVEGVTLKDALLVAEGRRAVTTGELARAIAESPWSQSEWAEMLGVSDGTISRWVNGQRAPRAAQAKRLARVLRQLAEAVVT